MNFDPKHPLTSLGVMGPVLGLIVFVVNYFKPGLGLTIDDAQSVVNQLDITIALLVSIYARWRATRPISMSAPLLGNMTPKALVGPLLALALMGSLTACDLLKGLVGQTNDPVKAQQELTLAVQLLRGAGCVTAALGEASAPIISVESDEAGNKVLSAVVVGAGKICTVPAPSAISSPTGTTLGSVVVAAPVPPPAMPQGP